MKKGLLDIDWRKVSDMSSEDISYYLFLEGKSIEAISVIRNIDKGSIQNHVINGKIKYRLYVKASSPSDMFNTILSAGKADKLQFIKELSQDNKTSLLEYIRTQYFSFNSSERESAIWILGELQDKNCIDILTRASVNKSVNLRRMSISALGKLGDKSVENVIIRALEDENPQVLQYAIKALIRIKSIKAKDKIVKIMDAAEKEYLKRAAEEYLIYINSDNFEVKNEL